MIGAIIGDIIGSTREFYYKKDDNMEYDLILNSSEITDDTILTCATANALMTNFDFNENYYNFTKDNPQIMGGYGGLFVKWIYKGKNRKPYKSYGNGSAMRVSPIGWFYDNEEEVLKVAKKSAEVTHNHPEGIKGAQVVAWSIFKLRNGTSKKELKQLIEQKFNYDLNFNLVELNKNYKFEPSCQKTVPQAIFCFLESSSFEETMRNVLYIGGDTDTIGAIAGSIAEAYYDIPYELYINALNKIKDKNIKLLNVFENFNKIKKTNIKNDLLKINNFIKVIDDNEITNIKFNKSDLLITIYKNKKENPIEKINNNIILRKINLKNQFNIIADDFDLNYKNKLIYIKEIFLLFLFNKKIIKNKDIKKLIKIIIEMKYNNIYIVSPEQDSNATTIAVFIKEKMLKDFKLLTDKNININSFTNFKINKIFNKIKDLKN